MRVISTKTHGAIDYMTGAALLAAPALLGISDEPAASRVLRGAGLAAAAYSLLTDYEFGLVRVIPMPTHLAIDAASDVLLAASPWLFGFGDRGSRYRLPHVVVGAAEVLAALTSKAR
jgi:SPW repeat